jgi:hypothetical protein
MIRCRRWLTDVGNDDGDFKYIEVLVGLFLGLDCDLFNVMTLMKPFEVLVAENRDVAA